MRLAFAKLKNELRSSPPEARQGQHNNNNNINLILKQSSERVKNTDHLLEGGINMCIAN